MLLLLILRRLAVLDLGLLLVLLELGVFRRLLRLCMSITWLMFLMLMWLIIRRSCRGRTDRVL